MEKGKQVVFYEMSTIRRYRYFAKNILNSTFCGLQYT